MFAAAPVLAARWSPAGLFGRGARLDDVVAVDVGLLLVALVLFGGAWRLLRRRPAAAPAPSLSESVAFGRSSKLG
jgi:hypothetical protein